jgi:VWFA-related protein
MLSRSNARSLLLLALALCGARAAAYARQAAPAPAPSAEPASIAIVVDTSSSTHTSLAADRKRLRQAFERFLEAGGGRDEFAVINVSTKSELYLDWAHDPAQVSKALSKLIASREPGASAFFDGCALAAGKARAGRHARRAVLALSDGVDTTSTLNFGEVEKVLKAAGVRLFAVEVGDRGAGGAYYEGGFRNLSGLAAASGGAFYRLNKAGELDSILAAVRSELGR